MPDFYTPIIWEDITKADAEELLFEFRQALIAKEHEPLEEMAENALKEMEAEIIRRLKL